MNTAPTTTMQMDPSGEELAGRRGDGQHPTMRQSLRFLVRIASLFVHLVRARLWIIIKYNKSHPYIQLLLTAKYRAQYYSKWLQFILE